MGVFGILHGDQNECQTDLKQQYIIKNKREKVIERIYYRQC